MKTRLQTTKSDQEIEDLLAKAKSGADAIEETLKNIIVIQHAARFSAEADWHFTEAICWCVLAVSIGIAMLWYVASTEIATALPSGKRGLIFVSVFLFCSHLKPVVILTSGVEVSSWPGPGACYVAEIP